INVDVTTPVLPRKDSPMTKSSSSVAVVDSQSTRFSAGPADIPASQSGLEQSIQVILANGRKNQELINETRKAHVQNQARLRRAQEAWQRVAAFKGARATRYVEKDPHDRYVELIMDLGAALKSDGWDASLQEVKPGSDAKTLAVATLRKAIDGDT